MKSDVVPVYASGIVPQAELHDFVSRVVVPSFWRGSELTSLDLKRVRFSPGEECAVLATLGLEPDSAARPQVVVTFTPKGELAKATKRHKKLSSAGGDFVMSPALGCMAEVFPSDWRLPSLQGLINEGSLKPALLAALEIEGAAEVYSLESTVLRYRPHSRAVLAFTLRTADGSVRAESVGKIYRNEKKAARAWRLLNAVHAQTAASPIVPRPVLWLDEAALVLMAKAPGSSLASLLTRDGNGDASSAGVRAAAEALFAFHGVETSEAKDRDADKDLKAARKLAKEMRPQTALVLEARKLLKNIDDLMEAFIRPVGRTLTHGAFKPSAVLVEGGQATIVDLDGCARGDPARDVGCFASKLREMAVLHDQPRLAALSDEFVQAYASRSPDALVVERARVYASLFLTGLALKNLNTRTDGKAASFPATLLLEARRQLR